MQLGVVVTLLLTLGANCQTSGLDADEVDVSQVRVPFTLFALVVGKLKSADQSVMTKEARICRTALSSSTPETKNPVKKLRNYVAALARSLLRTFRTIGSPCNCMYEVPSLYSKYRLQIRKHLYALKYEEKSRFIGVSSSRQKEWVF